MGVPCSALNASEHYETVKLGINAYAQHARRASPMTTGRNNAVEAVLLIKAPTVADATTITAPQRIPLVA